MYKGARFLSVIPARGGSKGLPRKNIRLLNGKSLLVYTIEQSLSVAAIDRTVVSSDDEEMLMISREAGADVIKRPPALASDKARTEDALIHALNELRAQGEEYDYVITLEPTHPLRQTSTITSAIELVKKNHHDSVLTLTADSTDFWIKRKNSYLRLFPKAPRRRQDRDPLYKENSLVYITASAVLEKSRFVIGKKPGVLLTPERESLDIHTAEDLRLAEFWIRAR